VNPSSRLDLAFPTYDNLINYDFRFGWVRLQSSYIHFKSSTQLETEAREFLSCEEITSFPATVTKDQCIPKTTLA
jgi:hypothetical protein